MDQIAIAVAAWLGITPGQLAVYLGIVVMVANLIGRAIPDTATGFLGGVRKVAKVVGLYLGNRVAPGVTNNTAAQAVIGFRGLAPTLDAAQAVKDSESVVDMAPIIQDTPPDLVGTVVPNELRTDPFAKGAEVGFKAQSPFLVGLLVLVVFLLTGCTAVQQQRVKTAVDTICMSVPLAQTAYNVALANHDNATANQIMDTIRVSCPAIETLITVYQPPVVIQPAVVVSRGERG